MWATLVHPGPPQSESVGGSVVIAVGSLVVAVVASMVDVAAVGMLVVDTGALAFPSASATVKRQIIVVTAIYTLFESILTVSNISYAFTQ